MGNLRVVEAFGRSVIHDDDLETLLVKVTVTKDILYEQSSQNDMHFYHLEINFLHFSIIITLLPNFDPKVN